MFVYIQFFNNKELVILAYFQNKNELTVKKVLIYYFNFRKNLFVNKVNFKHVSEFFISKKSSVVEINYKLCYFVMFSKNVLFLNLFLLKT